MRRVILAGSLTLVLVAVGGYATADVLDLAPGILTRDAPAPAPSPTATGAPTAPADLPTAAATAPDLLTSDGEDAPVPTEAGLARAVLRASDDPGVRQGLGVSVRDGLTGEQLYGRQATSPRVPASTAKVLSALAVADTLDLDERIPTAVVAAPGSSRLVLVARGDMLLDPGRGDADEVVGRAGLADLADDVAAALTSSGRTEVTLRLDLSFAPGPLVPPTWNPNDVRDGDAGPVAMTGLATRQARIGAAAPERPEVPVADAFAERLRARGVSVRLLPVATWSEPAPEDAEELGVVESATVGELFDHALDVSDDTLAESLVRQAAATAGEPTTGDTANGDFVRSRLVADGITVPGLVLKDASGLSPGQAVAPATTSAVLARAATGGSEPLRRLLAGLPVAGLDGTMVNRFGEAATDDVVGVPRAKSGTLKAGSALAGTTVTADGRPLLFSVQVDGFPRTFDGTLRARAALDRIVAALTRCGCR